jgi:hypothetical protein
MKPSKDQLHVTSAGSIVDQHGGVLYDADSISDLSDAAKQRLAELHLLDPDLEWEGCAGRLGAGDYLLREGLLPPPSESQ